MIINLFSLPIAKINLLQYNLDLDKIKRLLYPIFDKAKLNNVDLEKQGGISTYYADSHLHLHDELSVLNSIVLEQVKLYWKVLDISDNLEPAIDQCWANVHLKDSYTSQHSHSLMPIVASFYLAADPQAGDIVFINPMEYGLTHIPYNGPIESKIETSVHVKTGDLVLFPGWIRHKTQENLSGSDRIVITFNIKYKGTYLQSHSAYPDITQSHTSEVDMLTNEIYRQQMIINQLTKVNT